jgi:hypothetical protein
MSNLRAISEENTDSGVFVIYFINISSSLPIHQYYKPSCTSILTRILRFIARVDLLFWRIGHRFTKWAVYCMIYNI